MGLDLLIGNFQTFRKPPALSWVLSVTDSALSFHCPPQVLPYISLFVSMPQAFFHLASCPDVILGDMVEWCMYFLFFSFTSLSLLTFLMFTVLASHHYSNFLPFSSSPQDPSMQTRASTEAVAALYVFAKDTFEPKTLISPNSGLLDAPRPDAPNPLVFK